MQSHVFPIPPCTCTAVSQTVRAARAQYALATRPAARASPGARLSAAHAAYSATLHATWAVDALDPAGALMAGRVAKAYAARAARTVGETAVQVHGGIGNTWECMVHVYLRRALLSSQWLGDDGVQLRAIAAARTGGADGLS